MEDLISAIATAQGIGGVAIIRVSGDKALALAAKMFQPVGKTAVEDFKPNVLYAGNILCEGFSDFGMCVYFAPPKSFTGGAVVEFHCHGGVQIARGVLAKTQSLGARLATRGEFTKRAFVNGKLTLSSAEGMIDMINAESLAEVRAGRLLYGEKLSEQVAAAQAKLKNILALIAADTDYPEEGIEGCELASVAEDLAAIKEDLNALVKAYSGGKYIKSGVSVAICGVPNAGKSSLLNRLLGYDKAIVSPAAGTTRDVVEGTVEINGVKFALSDTAGIRDANCEVEEMGVARAKALLQAADVVLCLSPTGDFSTALGVEGGRLIKVFSKCDESAPSGEYDVAVSSSTGEGVERLKQKLYEKSLGDTALEGVFVIEERHYSRLKEACAKIGAALENLRVFPLDLISLDLRDAWLTLGEITGETADEAILDEVFSKFCVGK